MSEQKINFGDKTISKKRLLFIYASNFTRFSRQK